MIRSKTLVVHSVAFSVLMAAIMPAAIAAEPLRASDSLGRATAPAVSSQRIIVRYKDGTVESVDNNRKLAAVTAAATRRGLNRTASGALSASYSRKLGTGSDLIQLSQRLTKAQIEALVAELNANPAVDYASVDKLMQITRPAAKAGPDVRPAFVPNDQYYGQYQWHFSNPAGGVNAPAAWDITRGEGAVVAVLDTGILPDHPDMSANLLPGYDFIIDTFVSRDGDGRDANPLDEGDWNPVAGECYIGSPVTDSSWHGTHVSGTVAQVTNNTIGMAGLAHDAKVVPARVLGRCGGYTSDISDAMIWAAGGTVAGVPTNANPAEVINLSLGGAGACSAEEQAAINQAVGLGATVVIAAGNSAGNVSGFSPANCQNVIAVGANRINGGITYYSNYGAGVDLSAPGGGGSVDGNPNGYVWQGMSDGLTTPTSGEYIYGGYIGTSMAAPHVAATVALVQSALNAADRDALSPADMEELLKDTARPFPVSIPTATPIGAGIVDAKAALDEALEEPCDPEVEVCEIEATPIVNQVPLTGLSGSAGSEELYSITVPEGVTGPISILTYGGSGDVSLYVSYDEAPTIEDYDARSVRAGNSETVRFTPAQAGTYYIRLVGVRAYSNVTLQARHAEPVGGPGNELERSNLSGAAGSEQFFTLNVPAGAASLTFTLSPAATGDADMYVNFGTAPTTTTYSCRPYLGGTSTETCTVTNPQAGTWHVMVRGFSAFTGVTLTGNY